MQVGQTGTTVSREPHPAPGSSGALQHQAGMHRAGTVIANKKYTDAQIFEIADLGIIGEITKIVPELTSLLQERANQGSAQQLAAAETN